MAKRIDIDQNLIGEIDSYLFHEGTHTKAYQFMGAHATIENGINGVRFTTWAPNASSVCLIGDFNSWQISSEYNLQRISSSGLWSIFLANINDGLKYKFAVTNHKSNHTVYKSDPYAIYSEFRPNTASIISINNDFSWSDQDWILQRQQTNIYSKPMNIYELHLASWKTDNGQFMTYEKLSEILPRYIVDMGYTHVELMPLNEHPLDASWGYQATGYYSINSRHGNALGLKQLINQLHQHNIGVLLDWVPGHFCCDEHGLMNFDGEHCYEYMESWRANNLGWGTRNFDLGRNEVKSFLISNAVYWIEMFHIDGLRVDAVSNMLYLNYDRKDGEWQPNIYGNNHNLEGINFLKQLNTTLKNMFRGVITVAEESSAWPNITTPITDGGLGFDFKWNMGWMNDSLSYISLDPIYRKYHHHKINFSMIYHYSEKFILPISHDEVVHGKKSLVNKMSGDIWNKFAGLRCYTSYMIGHPGKKLSFMGNEFGQFIEWQHHEELQWHVIDNYNTHKETHHFFKQLNHFYLAHNSLWELDYDPSGFRWIDADNNNQSILSFVRYAKNRSEILIFICNFTPVVYHDFQLGVPDAGKYLEIFNSDALEFGGSGQIMSDIIFSIPEPSHGFNQKIIIKIPPMAVTIFKLYT